MQSLADQGFSYPVASAPPSDEEEYGNPWILWEPGFIPVRKYRRSAVILGVWAKVVSIPALTSTLAVFIVSLIATFPQAREISDLKPFQFTLTAEQQEALDYNQSILGTQIWYWIQGVLAVILFLVIVGTILVSFQPAECLRVRWLSSSSVRSRSIRSGSFPTSVIASATVLVAKLREIHEISQSAPGLFLDDSVLQDAHLNVWRTLGRVVRKEPDSAQDMIRISASYQDTLGAVRIAYDEWRRAQDEPARSSISESEMEVHQRIVQGGLAGLAGPRTRYAGLHPIIKNSDSSFGPYCLESLLGTGGFGQVWRAVDTRKGRVVALKLALSTFEGSVEYRARFQREAEIVASLNNQHVIPVHDYGEIDGRLYIDMRLVEGRDLRARLADLANRGERPNARFAVDIIRQAASALDSAHERELIHRDVKPENILIAEPDEFVYLADFGIARLLERTRITPAGQAIGTITYMSPEQIEGKGDHRTDVYSLGCVLYECLTGRPPYTGEARQLIAAHLFAVPPRPSVDGVAAGFDPVIACALSKDPLQRYSTAGDLARAASAVLENDHH